MIDPFFFSPCSTTSQFDNHYPENKICQFFKLQPVIFPSIVKNRPLRLVFLMVVLGIHCGPFRGQGGENDAWFHLGTGGWIKGPSTALPLFPEEPCDIYTDSVYVSNVTVPLETAAYVAPVSPICSCLLQVQELLWQGREPIYVGHVRGHSGLPGPLAEGNAAADLYARPQFIAVALDSYDLALQLHRKFHINSQCLRPRTGCTKEHAVQIVTQCPSCTHPVWASILGDRCPMIFGKWMSHMYLLGNWNMSMCP